MKARSWFVTSAALFLFSNVAQAQLVITEVVEGTGANFKYVEILNRGASSIDLGAAGAQLRRYTNGGVAATNIALTGTIPAHGFYVIANNATDFNAVFPLPAAANQYNTNVNHNGDDSYELFNGTSVVDTFAYDWVTGADPGSPASDGAYHRVATAFLPGGNNGFWGGTAAAPPADGGTSPNGYWIRDAMTAANGNAATICTPGTWGGSLGAELPVEIQTFEIK